MAILAGEPRYLEFKTDNDVMLSLLWEPLHRALGWTPPLLRRGDRGRGARG